MRADMTREKKIRILCVDDNLDSANIISQIINQEADLECLGCLSRADQLVNEVEKLNPDIVLLDLSMPGKDPLEAMAETLKRVPEMSFLVLSAYDLSEHRTMAFKCGARGYLMKDGDINKLLITIRKMGIGAS
jgi:DNA-binding NarL/FixJ family response regulator